jgi:protein-arginine kinase activator protein McsA
MPKLICQSCGTPFQNHNPKTKLCSDCNPKSSTKLTEKEIEWRDRYDAHAAQYDGPLRKKFMPE